MISLMNQVRGFHFLLGVLRNQQRDSFCGKCSAWNNTLNKAREELARFEKEHDDELQTSNEARRILAESRSGLNELTGPDQPSGQKKAGNCKLPEGICFVKASFALLQKI